MELLAYLGDALDFVPKLSQREVLRIIKVAGRHRLLPYNTYIKWHRTKWKTERNTHISKA